MHARLVLGALHVVHHGLALLFQRSHEFVARDRAILVCIHGVKHRLAEPCLVHAQAAALVTVQRRKKLGCKPVVIAPRFCALCSVGRRHLPVHDGRQQRLGIGLRCGRRICRRGRLALAQLHAGEHGVSLGFDGLLQFCLRNRAVAIGIHLAVQILAQSGFREAQRAVPIRIQIPKKLACQIVLRLRFAGTLHLRKHLLPI